MIITRTPYRLSFFGGGTDYNAWFEEHGGIVLAIGLAQYCYISVRFLPPYFEHRTRVVYSRIESVRDNLEIQHPSVNGCLQHMNISEGVEIHHDGDLPARSGLGSSSSFTVGLLHALHALQQRMIGPNQLALEAIDLEQNRLKESVGIQDQIIAAHGDFQIIKMGPGKYWDTNKMILPDEYISALEDHVLIGFSGISRLAEEHAKKTVENIKQGKTNEELLSMTALANEGIQAMLRQDGFDAIGRLLDQNWKLKRRLADSVSAKWMDDLYQVAIQKGAFGGKLMGAGAGGFFFFLAPPSKHQQIREALSQIKLWVPCKIDHSGSKVIFYNSG